MFSFIYILCFVFEQFCIGTAGQFQVSLGQIDCESCGNGSYSLAGASACTECEAGRQQKLEGQESCLNCEFGKMKSSAGTEDCVNCTSGTYTSAATTLFSCAECGTGRFQPLNGSTGCELCTNPSPKQIILKYCDSASLSALFYFVSCVGICS